MTRLPPTVEHNDAVVAVSFAEFYEESWPQTVGLAALLTGDSYVAAEIAQDVYIEIFRRWDEIRRPDLYAKAAIRNAARTRFRTNRIRHLISLDETLSGSSLLAVAEVDDTLDVRRALGKLSRSHAEVIVLRYYAGMADNEIAEVLNLRPGTAKSRIRRALANLHKELTDAS